MGLINISKLVQALGKETGGNSYSYLRITNLLNGIKGNSTRKDIQQIRRILSKELTSVDRTLEKLENQE